MTSAHHPFTVAAPSEAGVDAHVVQRFVSTLREREISLDSLLIYRGGRLVLDQYWWPYRADRPHMMHSATKSFVGTAAGFALAENLIRLDDTVASFFPEQVPANASANLRAMTVEDLLTMRTGHRVGLSGKTWRLLTTSWVEEFLRAEVEFPPGKAFTYSSASSHILSAIVQRAAGVTVFEYLRPRLFEPLGFSGHSWDTDPEGICSGGNGLSLRSVDFLKWGVLHLHDGIWCGRRVLPDGWVRAATGWHVENAHAGAWNGAEFVPRDPGESEERAEGYGYQIWLDVDGAYRASGMFGQDVFVLPHHDAVVATTGSIRHGRHRLLSGLLHDELVPAFSGTPSVAGDERLAAALAGTGDAPELSSVPAAVDVDGKRFRCAANPDGVEAISFRREADELVVTLEDARGAHGVRCGLAAWAESSTGVTGWQLHHSYQPESMRVLAGARWTAPDVLTLDWYFAESPFHDTVTVEFTSGDELRWHRRTNVNSGDTERPVITARAG
ncbi:serine hydrolase domain-containing protein [Amycolatopsis anabasis]|uniref:serine hydrolase domain-containing protein n=1 Tax=Amycolatopsis anabasis TaxID=1840409 RepID=UPI00131B7086|nr:serine hydrolase [Amycolatopsis anabasis]